MEEFIKSGTDGLKTNPKASRSEHRKQVIEEQALQIRVLKKSIELQELEIASTEDLLGA